MLLLSFVTQCSAQAAVVREGDEEAAGKSALSPRVVQSSASRSKLAWTRAWAAKLDFLTLVNNLLC